MFGCSYQQASDDPMRLNWGWLGMRMRSSMVFRSEWIVGCVIAGLGVFMVVAVVSVGISRSSVRSSARIFLIMLL